MSTETTYAPPIKLTQRIREMETGDTFAVPEKTFAALSSAATRVRPEFPDRAYVTSIDEDKAPRIWRIK